MINGYRHVISATGEDPSMCREISSAFGAKLTGWKNTTGVLGGAKSKISAVKLP
jgi:hypothetical protein